MGIPAALMLANGLVELAIRLFGAIKDDPATPEEARLRAEMAFIRLTATRDQIAAYTPVPPPA